MAKIVSDPQAGVESYKIDGLPGGEVKVPAQPDGSLLIDIGSPPPGSYDLNVYAEEGVFTSEAAPFTFASPGLVAPTGLKLIA
jgi:hypothetical protein